VATQNDLAWLEGRHVLVVDPDETVRDAIRRLLEPHGCRVIVASDGRSAIERVGALPREQRLDAVIADVVLPDMRGRELVTRLRESQGTMAAVLMTGFGYDPQCVVKPTPPATFLYKPFRAEHLRRALETALADRQE